ncbi:hypothetical protein X798_01504, partial [Onchocerca flexuosa]
MYAIQLHSCNSAINSTLSMMIEVQIDEVCSTVSGGKFMLSVSAMSPGM